MDGIHHLAKVRVAGSNPVFRSILAGQGVFFSTPLVLGSWNRSSTEWHGYLDYFFDRVESARWLLVAGWISSGGARERRRLTSTVRTVSAVAQVSHANLRLVFHRS
jgi:hypothetical protein